MIPRAIGLVLGAGLALTPVTPAHAAPGPGVRLEAAPHYTLGQLNTYYEPGYGLLHWDLPAMQWRWQVAPGVRVCRQTLTQQSYNTLGGRRDPVLGSDTVTRAVPAADRRAAADVSDAEDYWRGGDRAVVRVTDCQGRTATSGVGAIGWSPGPRVTVVEDTSARLTYAGTWRTARSTGFSGGTTHTADVAGAAVTTTVRGGPVALVVERAASRGEVDVYVDGARRARVDTAAASPAHRSIVWESLLAPGSHSLRLVAVGTAGRPRVDLDALLLP